MKEMAEISQHLVSKKIHSIIIILVLPGICTYVPVKTLFNNSLNLREKLGKNLLVE